MKFIEPNITFSSTVLREKKFNPQLYNLIDPLCQDIDGSKLYYHISSAGEITILRYRVLNGFVVSRLLRFYPKLVQFDMFHQKNWMQDFDTGQAIIANLLFLNSASNYPSFQEHEYFNLYDSSVIKCHQEAFPIVIRDFIKQLSNNDRDFEKHCKILESKVPFLIGGKYTHCPYLLFNTKKKYYHCSLEEYVGKEGVSWLKSLTNSWLLQMKRKNLRLLNREIVIPV